MADFPKIFSHHEVEKKWYAYWLEKGVFTARTESPLPAYTIVIPPPNVTGSLHMGHALTVTIQDVLIRYKRMNGFNALWLPGTDHAGIATQMVVEREIAKDGKSRYDLGREKFIERVWDWKNKFGDRINEQLKAIGSSLDWTRERFTMDEMLSRAVREAFVRLYEEGLIYRDLRLINWCPRCRTALSDLEVEHVDEAGKLYHIRYPAADGGEGITVATTRPETMLGDTAVAVHPEDGRYRDKVGKLVHLPLTGRRIPIIADHAVKPEFGTGAVKITPAHDFDDFEVGQRHGLPMISMLDEEGRIAGEMPVLAGEPAKAARERIVEMLRERGLLLDITGHPHAVGHCQRCRSVAEPMLSRQWFVKAKPLAEPAIRAVESGETRIIPEGWEKTYFHWMRNIRDWCISRQLWWGHRIPVWYCGGCAEVIVSRADPSRCPACGSAELRQDEDVLDTWFSSALWPFSTLGWPDETADMKTFYPTSVMETGFDIIFFWVARMMMMGIHFTGKVPFRTVYLHAMVRDIEGKKMTKTRGNVVDPIEVTSEHGSDALRFTLAMLTAQGRDIKFSIERVVGYRNFANKLWNACRFAFINAGAGDPRKFAPEGLEFSTAERWILSRLQAVTAGVREAIDSYRFNEASSMLYQFLWHEVCDWYIEISKPALSGDLGPGLQEGARAVLLHVLSTSLKLLHPFMPFITEELHQRLPVHREAESLALEKFPEPQPALADRAAETEMELVVESVTGIRNIRGESNIPPSARLAAVIWPKSAGKEVLFERHGQTIAKLAALSGISLSKPGIRPRKSATCVTRDAEIFIPLEAIVDFEAERGRISREIEKVGADLEFVRKKLASQNFTLKAPAEVVEKERAKEAEISRKWEKLAAHLEWLKD